MSNQLPTAETLQNAFKLSLKTQKEIDTYFYLSSLSDGNTPSEASLRTVNGETTIYKNSDEHSTSVSNIYTSGNSFIVVTENTIHIVSNGINVQTLD